MRTVSEMETDITDDFTLWKQGAEARLFTGNYLGKSSVMKERFTKSYRNSTLDAYLTKERIKAEAKTLVRCRSAGKDRLDNGKFLHFRLTLSAR